MPKPKAQIILDAAKVSAASGETANRSRAAVAARGLLPRSTMRVPQPDIIEHFGNADAVPQLPERCLSRKAKLCGVAIRHKNSKARQNIGVVRLALLFYIICDISCHC